MDYPSMFLLAQLPLPPIPPTKPFSLHTMLHKSETDHVITYLIYRVKYKLFKMAHLVPIANHILNLYHLEKTPPFRHTTPTYLLRPILITSSE